MSTLDQARDTQLKNIETKTGKSLAELRVVIRESGLTKHSEVRTMLMEKFNLGYGDANSLVHFALESDGQTAAQASGAGLDEVIGAIYSGKNEGLRPIHDRVMAAIEGFGEFEVAPKKGYISLRRRKQFAMVGPGTKSRLEVGINMKGVESTERLQAMPPGGMCQYKVFLSQASEVDDELIGWVRQAYEGSG
jgi:hypothetical protein